MARAWSSGVRLVLVIVALVAFPALRSAATFDSCSGEREAARAESARGSPPRGPRRSARAHVPSARSAFCARSSAIAPFESIVRGDSQTRCRSSAFFPLPPGEGVEPAELAKRAIAGSGRGSRHVRRALPYPL